MPHDPLSTPSNTHLGRREFVHRAWIVVLMVVLVGGGIMLLWKAADVALVFLGAVLLAIFLRGPSAWVSARTRLSYGWSLGIVIFGLVGVFVLVGWLVAAPISQQVDQLKEALPKAIGRLQSQLEGYGWWPAILRGAHEQGGLTSQAGALVGKAGNIFSVTAEGVAHILLILFCGFYLAAQPELYTEGFLQLVPGERRPRARMVLEQIGTSLQRWLLGQIIAMSIIGLLTWLGLLLLGIPLSGALGLLAGVLDFVPIAGPWVAGILSCLVALLKSPVHAVYVACLFVSLHFFEGHVLIPKVQQRSTRLPPALTLIAMVLFTKLFGFLGLLLATPLLALVVSCVQALYVEGMQVNNEKDSK